MQKEFRDLPIDLVHPSPTNPRKRFNQVKLQELADSIEKHDVMQPIVVRPMPGLFESYEIVAGERRWRGSKLANKPTIPAIVRELTDLEVLQLQVIENAQRDDLHPMEEAKGFRAILDNQDATHWNADQLAEKIGKSRTYIYNTLKLNELCLYAQDMFLDDHFGREIALLIARIPGEQLQTQATKEIIKPDLRGNKMSYRKALEYVQERYTLKLASAPFKITDIELVPAAGSCKTCPSRSGNAAEIFPDIKSPDVCTNPDCFNQKRLAHIERLRNKGDTVIDGAEAKKIMPHSWNLHKDYVKLEANCPGKAESIEKILGNDADCVLTIVDPDDGELVKVAKKTDITEALRDKGIDVTFSATRDYTAEQKEKEREFKMENAYRLKLLGEVSDSLRANLDVNGFLEEYEEMIIAKYMLDRLDHENGKRLLRFLGISFTTDEGPYKAKQQLSESIQSMSSPERLLLIMQMALISECHANEYSPGPPEDLNQVAGFYGIDQQAIRTLSLEQFAPKSKAAKEAKTSPTPLPAAQAQELTPDAPTAEPVDEPTQAAEAASTVETSEPVANPSPAPLPDEKSAEAARFAAIRKAGEAKAAKRAANKTKKQEQEESA